METTISFEPETQVLHWLPAEARWDLIPWSAWMSFRAIFDPFKPLPGITSGVHCFIVCIHGDDYVFNLIPHKYLIEPDGQIGPSNFMGWNKEDRADYERLMVRPTLTRTEEVRVREIQYRTSDSMYPPPNSALRLQNILPRPTKPGSPADKFLRELFQLYEYEQIPNTN